MAERRVFVDHSTLHRWSMKICLCWQVCSASASAPLARAGEWMRPTSRSAASGSNCTKRSTRAATPSISSCVPSTITPRHEYSSSEPSTCTACPRNHHRQEWRQHGRHREHSGRQRLAHRDAPIEVSQQRRRARPSSHQTDHPADARIQDLSLRAHPARRHRNHAHDSQGSARRSQRPRLVCGEPVLFAGVLIGVGHAAMLGLIALSRQSQFATLVPDLVESTLICGMLNALRVAYER